MKRLFLTLILTFSLSTPAMTAELAGVTMPDSVDVGGKTLVLNGLGLRSKSFIKVYVAGLYLPEKMQGAKNIITANTERRLVMDFLRGVGAGKIQGAWADGLKNNTANPSPELKKQFVTLNSYMEDMPKGGKMTFTYVPGSGTTINVNGKNKGTIAGKPFADALWKSLIGPNPPGEEFKAGLVAGR